MNIALTPQLETLVKNKADVIMHTNRIRTVFFMLSFLLFSAVPAVSAFSAQSAIQLTDIITDLSGKLLEGAPESLSAMIREDEAGAGPKVKVLLINDPGNETLDAFAERTLKAQTREVRPDALLVISVNQAAARIAVTEEAGKRLNGVAIRSLLRESVMESVRDGYYYSAIEHGTREMHEVLQGKKNFGPDPAGMQKAAKSPGAGKDGLVAIPPYAPVTDLTGTLAAGDIEGLRSEISSLEQRKGSQIAVLMLPTTKPESIEQYALKVFDSWKLGRKGVDDGVLIIAAKDDRRMRIEVGYGLEPVLTDLVAGRIIDEQMTPLFRKGDFGGGLTAAVQRVVKVIGGEALPPPRPPAGYIDQWPETWVFVAAGVIIVVSVVLSFWIRYIASTLLAGVSAGALFWFNASAGAAIFLSAFAAILTYMLSEGPRRKGRRVSWSDAFGGSSGRDGGSSSGSSGSDSGGGGSSGGGGASGSW